MDPLSIYMTIFAKKKVKSRYDIEVRFADIDVMGHVNNAVYLSYFEQARIGFFKLIADENWDWQKLGILLAKNEVNYLAPLLLNDEAWIETRCVRLGEKSMTFAYEIKKMLKGQGMLITTGQSVLVCFDATTQKTISVPDAWRSGITVLPE